MAYLTFSALQLGLQATKLRCIVIHSEKARPVLQKYASMHKRYVLNFTVKDENNESMNVSCWGEVDYVIPISEICSIGAIVEISNGKVVANYGSAFRPCVTSKFGLELMERTSRVCLYNGEMDEFTALVLDEAIKSPLGSPSDLVTIQDVHNNDKYGHGCYVNIIAVLSAMSGVVSMTTKDGRRCRRLELKITDQTLKSISLLIWDPVLQKHSSLWKSFETVVYLTDARVTHNNYGGKKMLAVSSRTVCTTDPNTQLGRDLAVFASRYLAGTQAALESIGERHIVFDRLRAVALPSVASLAHFIVTSDVEMGCHQLAIITCFVTRFDLTNILFWKCSHCGTLLTAYNGQCNVPDKCSSIQCCDSEGEADFQLTFKLDLSLTDATGTLKRCRLSGQYAETVLQMKAEDFLVATDTQKEALRRRFLLERCQVGFKIEWQPINKKILSIVYVE